MEIKKLFKEHAASSSFLAYSRIFKTENYLLKFIWLCLLISSSILSIQYISKAISSYLNYAVVTNIDVIHSNDIQFPMVTFYFHNNPKDNRSFENILLFCIFSDFKCDPTEIRMLVDEFGFVSYQFKTNKPGYSGRKHGLTLAIKNVLGNSNYPLNGIRVLVHDTNQSPLYSYGKTGVDIAPGFHGNLLIKKIVLEKLGEPHNNCIKDVKSLDSSHSEIYKFILTKTNYTYTKEDCIEYCAGRELLRFYNMTPEIEYLYNVLNRLKIEVTPKDTLLLYQRYRICIDLCPLECDSVSYEVAGSMSKIFQNSFLNENNLTIDDVIYFNIYFAESKYTKISQIPKMELFDLVSSIGGIIGAFMGISFLFMCELFELIMKIIIIKYY